MNIHAILMCTQASIADAHLLGQLCTCGIVQLVAHLGIIAYSHSFQITKYLNVFYKVNMYIHDCIRVEKDNMRTECDARHTISKLCNIIITIRTYIGTRSV